MSQRYVLQTVALSVTLPGLHAACNRIDDSTRDVRHHFREWFAQYVPRWAEPKNREWCAEVFTKPQSDYIKAMCNAEEIKKHAKVFNKHIKDLRDAHRHYHQVFHAKQRESAEKNQTAEKHKHAMGNLKGTYCGLRNAYYRVFFQNVYFTCEIQRYKRNNARDAAMERLKKARNEVKEDFPHYEGQTYRNLKRKLTRPGYRIMYLPNRIKAMEKQLEQLQTESKNIEQLEEYKEEIQKFKNIKSKDPKKYDDLKQKVEEKIKTIYGEHIEKVTNSLGDKRKKLDDAINDYENAKKYCKGLNERVKKIENAFKREMIPVNNLTKEITNEFVELTGPKLMMGYTRSIFADRSTSMTKHGPRFYKEGDDTALERYMADLLQLIHQLKLDSKQSMYSTIPTDCIFNRYIPPQARHNVWEMFCRARKTKHESIYESLTHKSDIDLAYYNKWTKDLRIQSIKRRSSSESYKWALGYRGTTISDIPGHNNTKPVYNTTEFIRRRKNMEKAKRFVRKLDEKAKRDYEKESNYWKKKEKERVENMPAAIAALHACFEEESITAEDSASPEVEAPSMNRTDRIAGAWEDADNALPHNIREELLREAKVKATEIITQINFIYDMQRLHVKLPKEGVNGVPKKLLSQIEKNVSDCQDLELLEDIKSTLLNIVGPKGLEALPELKELNEELHAKINEEPSVPKVAEPEMINLIEE